MRTWRVSEEEARTLQLRLAPLVSDSNSIPEKPQLVAGVDVSHPDAQGRALGVAALLTMPDLEVVQTERAFSNVTFPYIPGLLAFREASCMLAALELLETSPDFVLVDGHGLAHPRRFGLACHVGVLMDLPTIGCAGSRLLGRHDPVGMEKGDWVPLTCGEEVVGAALRSRDNTRPVYISVGHKVDLDSAVRWTTECCVRYRLPEPLRVARQAAREGIVSLNSKS